MEGVDAGEEPVVGIAGVEELGVEEGAVGDPDLEVIAPGGEIGDEGTGVWVEFGIEVEVAKGAVASAITIGSCSANPCTTSENTEKF